MIPTPTIVETALPYATETDLVAELLTGGQTYELPVVDWTITADPSRVARYALEDLTIDPDVDPALLRPYGARVRCWHRIAPVGQAPALIPAGLYRLTDRARRLSTGELRTMGTGLERSVDRDELTGTRVIQSGSTVSAIRQLITQAVPDAQLRVADDVEDKPVPRVVFEQSRWKACTELADSISCEVYADATGRFVITPAATLDDPVVWTATEGEGGVVADADEELSDADVVNEWIITGERTDDTPPVKAVARDNDEHSPTYANGTSLATGDHFGRFSRSHSSPLFTSVDQCRKAGRTRLAKSTGLSEALSLTTVMHPGLEPGDVIETVIDGQTSRRVVDSISWGPGLMSVQTRVVRRVVT